LPIIIRHVSFVLFFFSLQYIIELLDSKYHHLPNQHHKYFLKSEKILSLLCGTGSSSASNHHFPRMQQDLLSEPPTKADRSTDYLRSSKLWECKLGKCEA